MKRIKSLFSSKKKICYNPSSTDSKNSKKEGKERRESFKPLEFPEENRKENLSSLEYTDGSVNTTENNDDKTNTLTMDEFEFIAPIPEDRYNEVIIHLRNNFFADEPLNKSVGLCKLGEPHAELESHSLNTLNDQLSVMAVHKESDKVAAVSLNGITLPGDIEQGRKKLEGITDDKFKQIFTLLYDLNDSLDLFSKYDVDKIFDARILSVDSNYRGKGLGKKCIKMGEDFAKESGFKLMKGDATGVFSQHILTSLGWECVHELKYEDHVDEDGEQIFKPPAPHESLKIMVQLFNKEELRLGHTYHATFRSSYGHTAGQLYDRGIYNGIECSKPQLSVTCPVLPPISAVCRNIGHESDRKAA